MLPSDWSERWPNPNGFTTITHRVEVSVARRWAIDGTVLRLREGQHEVVLSGQESGRSNEDASPYNATMLVSVKRTGTRNILHMLGDRVLDVEVDEIVFLVTVGVASVLSWRSDANLRRFIDLHIDSLIWRPRHLETRSATDNEEHAEWVPVDDGNDDSDEPTRPLQSALTVHINARQRAYNPVQYKVPKKFLDHNRSATVAADSNRPCYGRRLHARKKWTVICACAGCCTADDQRNQRAPANASPLMLHGDNPFPLLVIED
ncbi:hypothetical protein MCOR08_003794 [Pyricularia oryzae]|nr:hypothetical protein MCOR08_003794 [Pyricularia oryzae]